MAPQIQQQLLLRGVILVIKVALLVAIVSHIGYTGRVSASPPQHNTDGTEWMSIDEVKITSLKVPRYVRKGETADLECQWSPSKNIYSLKWYFNDEEFFSYKPEANPSVVILTPDGFKVNVSVASVKGEKITLTEVQMSASGSYKCEVTMEDGFVTADKSGELTVVDVPNEKPRITGTEHQYRIGDVADLTCTSAPSTPVANITWFINNEKAPSKYLTPLRSTRHPGGQQEAHQGLRFTVSRKHFIAGEMTLKCTASIPHLFMLAQEQHSTDDLLIYNIPVLSSLENSAAPPPPGGTDGGGWSRKLVVVMVGVFVAVVGVLRGNFCPITLPNTQPPQR